MINTSNNKDLTKLNTFGMRVSCTRYIEYDSISDLMDLDFEELPQPVKHIGGGSNLLFTGDFKGTILHSKIDFIEQLEDGLVSVGSGVIFDDLCEWAAQNGLWGIENLTDIPGETGAAAVQNIGAYGVEFKDVVEAVYCYDPVEYELIRFSREECEYGYRHSIFKTEDYRDLVVTHVLLRLSKDAGPRLEYGHLAEAVSSVISSEAEKSLTPAIIRKVIRDIRAGKLPDPKKIGSAGSFFKNPVVSKEVFEKVQSIAKSELGQDYQVPHYILEGDMVKIPAAWLIEQCGWKGRRSGNAGVYEKQPLVLVNATGRALPDEIIALENRIIASVKSKYGIILSPEVEHIS